MSPSADQLRAGAEAASAALPALMLSAERLAASLTAGAHGQRRAGTGEDFWQYRPATQGDTARSIDWRRSARSDGQFVRDREAQVAQSAVLWVSAAAGMDFSGGADRPAKRDRAALLALALALGLLAGGERVALAGQPPRPGRMQADRIAEALVARAPLPADEDTPPAEALRPGQRIVLIDDFLGDPTPVLFLSAKGRPDERVEGLRAGGRRLPAQAVSPARVFAPGRKPVAAGPGTDKRSRKG